MDLLTLFDGTENAQEFAAGTTIFSEGAPGDVMYVVLDGEVEASVRGKMIEVIGPGNPIGEMALIDTKARSATVVAKTDCRLAPVDDERFLSLVQQTPSFALYIMRILVERLRRTTARRGA